MLCWLEERRVREVAFLAAVLLAAVGFFILAAIFVMP
jgi:hypothetical protein